MNSLKDKVAVIYGNRAVGGAIARALGGAGPGIAGRTPEKLKTIANKVFEANARAGGVTLEQSGAGIGSTAYKKRFRLKERYNRNSC